MVNRMTRILGAAALLAAAGSPVLAQSYAVSGPPPAYPPDVYQAQDADGGYAEASAGPGHAYYSQSYQDHDRSDHARYDQGGYDQGARREQPQGRAWEDQRARRQSPANENVYRQAPARRVEASYRYLSWSGKVEEQDQERDGYADRNESSRAYSTRHVGPQCPSVKTGERVLDCRYIPFAPPEAQGEVLSSLYIDGGVGPTVIGGGGGGGGGASNGQIFLGTGFSGVSVPSFNGGGGGNGGGSGNGSGSGSGSGTGVGTGTGTGSGVANSSSSSSASASASVSASLSSSITIGGGFFYHGGGGHWGGGGKPSGPSCGCSTGGGMAMNGGGHMGGWGGGHKK